MLAFITSMRHPSNAANYAHNERLLAETLACFANQTSDEYVVIVVGNQEPSFDLPPHAHFVPVDYAAPPRANGLHADRTAFVRDKGTKIGAGLIAAREFEPDWVMIFDADDFVHRGLVQYVHSNPSSPGWVIERGLMYSRARNGYLVQNDFHRTCGTSYVIPFEAYQVPDDLPPTATQDDISRAFGEVLPNIMGAHRNAVQWHREHGRELRTYPTLGAVYQVDTGENHSGKKLAGVIRPWTPALREDYGIQPQKGRLATALASYGPVAVWQSAVSFYRRAIAAISRRVARDKPDRAA
jgi:hypothetical protein